MTSKLLALMSVAMLMAVPSAMASTGGDWRGARVEHKGQRIDDRGERIERRGERLQR